MHLVMLMNLNVAFYSDIINYVFISRKACKKQLERGENDDIKWVSILF